MGAGQEQVQNAKTQMVCVNVKNLFGSSHGRILLCKMQMIQRFLQGGRIFKNGTKSRRAVKEQQKGKIKLF